MSTPADWDERYRSAELVWSREPNVFVAEEVGDLPPGRALDVAAGEGRNAIWLASRGWRVTAVDFSPVALDKARRLAAAQEPAVDVDWVLADVRSHEAGPAAYDLVVVAYLQLPHYDRCAALQRAAAAVAPGGVLVVVAHASRNLTEGAGGPPNAAVLYSPADVVADIAASGLVVDVAEERPRPVPESARPAIDTVVRAHRPPPSP